ncbi:MAG: histidine phosphatase family protein [Thermomicrobia bacterium]|nr:histidine phosphatase family protein [Thermomicrobia bacterium]
MSTRIAPPPIRDAVLKDAARFLLVRHGEAEGNRELRYLGASDVALTTRGRQQATLLARALRPLPLRAIYSSPLARARDTAAAVAAETGLGVTICGELRENDYGAWERLTRVEVSARDAVRLAAWEAGEDVAPPDGERLTDVQARVVACVDALVARHSGEMVVLVSHVGPIKALICAALGLPPTAAHRMWLDPASISTIDWRRAADGRVSGIMRGFNLVAHLHDLD